MADYDAFNVQFLDLTDVEEEERKWIINLLQIRDSTVKGPWNRVECRSHQINFQGSVVQGNGIPQQYVTSVYTPTYPQQQIILPQHPQPFVGQFASPLVVNGPVVAGNATVVSINPVPVPTILPVNTLPTIINNQFSPQIPYATYPVQPPSIKPNVTLSYTYAVNNPTPSTPENCNNSTPTTRECHVQTNVTIDESCNNLSEDDLQPSVDNVNNLSNGCRGDTNENVKNDRSETKSWASLFNKPNNNNNTIVNNGVHDADKQSTKVAPTDSAKTKLENANENKKQQLAGFDDPNYYRMAETLINYSIDHRITSLQPRGLINPGNYCYINSILQALLACPPVYNLLVALSDNVVKDKNRKHTQIIDNLVKFAKEFQHLPPGQRVHRRSDNTKAPRKDIYVNLNCDSPFEPSWIYKMLNGMRSDFFVVEGRQEDAEEFLGCLLNGLNDEMLELMKLVDNNIGNTINTESTDRLSDGDREWQVIGPKNKGCVTRRTEIVRTPISDIFGGHIRSRLHRTGDHITDNIQPFFTLQLNIEKANSVKEALEALVCKNRLEGVTSSKTNEEVEAWQQVTIEQLPVVLILHLKCFDFKLDGCTKIIKALEFPIDLKIDSNLLSSKNNYQPKAKQYKLFAIVYHDGKEATKGHYLTDAYHVGYASWLRYDDAAVKVVQDDQVLKPQGTRVPYLLFYRRSDTVQRK